MRVFKVLCETCHRRLGLGEEWIPTRRPGGFECTRCADERFYLPARQAVSSSDPPRVAAA